ncbi:hypothetical protein [Photorhabdus asymbiotica]|uniref:hypothetical protein n=1 Tax=Photorhabdus asymbiotica TaxID=291112 RepID=UPI002013349D|nr:hypothetical protein [Photorhabdus asymbiotica]
MRTHCLPRYSQRLVPLNPIACFNHRFLDKAVKYHDQRLLIGIWQQVRFLPQGM